MTAWKTLACVSAVVVLGGCALRPAAPVAPEELAAPAGWQLPAYAAAVAGAAPDTASATSPSTSPDTAPDWAGLLDPQVATLQAQALAASADLAQAALRVQQAERQVRIGALRLTPRAGLSANASRPLQQEGSTRSVEIGGISVPVSTEQGWSRSHGASIGVGWEWDLWDRLAQQQRAAVAQVDGAQADREAARLLIRNRVADSYWQLAAADAQRPLVQAQADAAERLLAIQRVRVQEGKLAPIEIDKAATALAQARGRLADLQAECEQQGLQLASWLGVPLAQLQARLKASPPLLPQQPLPRWQPGPPAEVLERRPDVRRARAAVDAALARRAVSEAERYPRLSLSVGVSTGGERPSDWLQQPLASLAANLVVPLIDWRRLDIQREMAQGELELAALALRDGVARALLEVDTQRLELQRLQRQRVVTLQRLAETRRAEQQAQLRLELGALGRAEFLQIHLARLDAELSEITLRQRSWQAQAMLARVLALR
jgi:outer membrane protein TolC